MPCITCIENYSCPDRINISHSVLRLFLPFTSVITSISCNQIRNFDSPNLSRGPPLKSPLKWLSFFSFRTPTRVACEMQSCLFNDYLARRGFDTRTYVKSRANELRNRRVLAISIIYYMRSSDPLILKPLSFIYIDR